MLENKIKEELKKFGQLHLLQYWDDLSPKQKSSFSNQLNSIDLTQVKRLIEGNEAQPNWAAMAASANPPDAIRLNEQNTRIGKQAAIEAGSNALRAGRIAMILVAGGQGTRLGFSHPKGMFPIGPLSNRTLFEMHIDRLRAVMKRYHVSIPMYVMTSPATDAETRLFLSDHDGFGLASDQLRIFCQGSMPAIDAKTGKILLADRGEVALSPDGHGGLLAAMAKNGCLEDAGDAGIDLFFYAQVDNPMVEVCDPLLIGYHLLAGSEMTTQVVRKTFPLERVGNVVSIDGRTQIIEYSDLPKEIAEKTNSDGSLHLWAGNIAVHVFQRRFLETVQHSVEGLPFHQAKKPVPYIDVEGNLVKPTEANAIKFERFVFDLLPMAKQALVVESDPAEVFSPVKNAESAATDTPTTVKHAISKLHRGWLLQAGASVAENAIVEIHPNWALDVDDVRQRVDQNFHIATDTYLQ